MAWPRQAWAEHDCDTAVSDYEIGVAIARATGSAAKAAFYFRRIGLCRAEQGRTELALDAYRQGIAAAEQTDDIEILGENLHGAAVQLGRYGEELPLSEREYALTLKCGHPDHQLRALFTYSSTMSELGHYREALVLGRRAVEVSHQASQLNAVELAAGNLAMYYAYLGDLESALRILLSHADHDAKDWNAIGATEKRLHRYAEAERAYAAALAQSGAAFGTTAVYFPVSATQAFGGTTLPAPTGTSTVIITGLAPNTGYSVGVQNNVVTVFPNGTNGTSDQAGVLTVPI